MSKISKILGGGGKFPISKKGPKGPYGMGSM